MMASIPIYQPLLARAGAGEAGTVRRDGRRAEEVDLV
jgi:hypothetical protein